MKTQDAKIRDGRYVYTLFAKHDEDNGVCETVLEYNLLRKHLIHFLDTYKENVNKYVKYGFGEVRPNNTESTSDTTVSETDTTGHES